jgi:hypothetical protein
MINNLEILIKINNNIIKYYLKEKKEIKRSNYILNDLFEIKPNDEFDNLISFTIKNILFLNYFINDENNFEINDENKKNILLNNDENFIEMNDKKKLIKFLNIENFENIEKFYDFHENIETFINNIDHYLIKNFENSKWDTQNYYWKWLYGSISQIHSKFKQIIENSIEDLNLKNIENKKIEFMNCDETKIIKELISSEKLYLDNLKRIQIFESNLKPFFSIFDYDFIFSYNNFFSVNQNFYYELESFFGIF